MKIVLVGSTGQLGSALARQLAGEDIVSLSHAAIEVADPVSVRKAFEQYRPELVINTSAFHRVDDCESQLERAFALNCFAVRDLSLMCREFKAALMHFSTDFVFGDDQRWPYKETDLPHPLSVYGASKLAGEHLVASVLPEHFLIRSCGLYHLGGSKSKGGNFVEAMLRKATIGGTIRVVDDQVVTPTHAPELARKVAQLIHTRHYGLYHITCQGECSWFEFAAKIFELSGLKPDLRRTTSAELHAPARRPSYSVLENAKLKSLGMDDVKPWQEALADYLKARRHETP